jgi:hypothetical protein
MLINPGKGLVEPRQREAGRIGGANNRLRGVPIAPGDLRIPEKLRLRPERREKGGLLVGFWSAFGRPRKSDSPILIFMWKISCIIK